MRKVYSPLFEPTSASYKSLDLYQASEKAFAYNELGQGWRSWQASVALTPGLPGLELFPHLNLGMAYALL